MTKGERSLLVLSPRLRTAGDVGSYKPFGRKLLAVILRDVAVSVSRQKHRRYDTHAVFRGFFFGRAAIGAPVEDELRNVPACLIDCAMDASDDKTAVAAARAALADFAAAGPARKSAALLCEHDCRTDIGVETQRTRNDDTLFAHLYLDLCGDPLKRIAQLMARRWNG